METVIEVPVKIYSESRHSWPDYAKRFDSGMDVRVFLPDAQSTLTLVTGAKAVLPTGLYVGIPPGYELQVRPRSGTSIKTGLRIANSPGTIDSNYRGEIGIIVENTGPDYIIQDGERIAQLVLAPVVKCVWKSYTSRDDLGSTDRGAGGFGSTGAQ